MPRDIPVGNGRLLICFDQDYAIRDLYYPHVGFENHVRGNRCRMGIFVDGQFSWVGSGWARELVYESDTLVTKVTLSHSGLGVRIECHDTVDFHENIFLRELRVENLMPEPREIRVFFSQDLDIYGTSVGNTAAYDPKTGGIVHYKGQRYFLFNAQTQADGGPHQFATGQKTSRGMEGTFRDAEDGLLSGNPIAQGSVDSVIGLSLTLDGSAAGNAYYWISAGQTWEDVRVLDASVKQRHPEQLIKRTRDYWHLWARKETPSFHMLEDSIAQTYRRSLLILRTQIDWQGGILAANDSDVIQFNRDTYSYIWPRDGALVANAMDQAGYVVLSENFYRFIAGLVGKEGYLLHKYNPDGTLASSWHPWYEDGQERLPIQEDETALVVWALWKHFVLYRNIEFIKPLYRPLVKNTADFMCSYRDSTTGLPEASYDLWEERRGVLSYTVGAVFGGLTAASIFCRIFGEEHKAEQYRKAAAEIRDGASKHLWQEKSGRFCRMLYHGPGGELEVDDTCDASLWALFAFGLFSADDPRLVSTMNTLRQRLWVNTPVGGMARYENDPYHRVSQDLPGNPWFICTLWLADYLIERSKTIEDLDEAIAIMKWVADHALPSGVLAEQVHPFTGAPLSVSPLTWSHATFVSTTHRLVRKLGSLLEMPESGLALIDRARTGDWIGRLYNETCDSIHELCKV